MADARQFPAPHPDFLSMSPSGRTAVIFHPDDSASVVELLLMTRVSMAPTGSRNACPFCRTRLAVAPFEPISERRCPRCEACLWALALPTGPMFFVRPPGQSVAEFIAELAGPGLSATARDIADFLRRADRFDLVEFMEEVEAASGPLGHLPDV
jgi:hypothetical protein